MRQVAGAALLLAERRVAARRREFRQFGRRDANLADLGHEAVDDVAAHAQHRRAARIGGGFQRSSGARRRLLVGRRFVAEQHVAAHLTQRLHALAFGIAQQQGLADGLGRLRRQDEEIEPALAAGQHGAVADDLGFGGEPGDDRLAKRRGILEIEHQLVDIGSRRDARRELADIVGRQHVEHRRPLPEAGQHRLQLLALTGLLVGLQGAANALGEVAGLALVEIEAFFRLPGDRLDRELHDRGEQRRRHQLPVGDAGGNLFDQKQRLGRPRHREALQDRLRRVGKGRRTGRHPLAVGRPAIARCGFQFTQRSRQAAQRAHAIVGEHPGKRLGQRRRAGIAARDLAQQPRLQRDLGDAVRRLPARPMVERQLLPRQERVEVAQGLGDLLELHDAGGVFEGVQRVQKVAARGLVGIEGAGQLGQPRLQQFDEEIEHLGVFVELGGSRACLRRLDRGGLAAAGRLEQRVELLQERGRCRGIGATFNGGISQSLQGIDALKQSVEHRLGHRHAAVAHQPEQIFRPVRHGFHAVERHRPRQAFERVKAAEQPRHVAGLALGRAQADQQRLEHSQMLVAFRRELLPERLDELVHGRVSGLSPSRRPTASGRDRARGAPPGRSHVPSWPGGRGSWRRRAWR